MYIYIYMYDISQSNGREDCPRLGWTAPGVARLLTPHGPLLAEVQLYGQATVLYHRASVATDLH